MQETVCLLLKTHPSFSKVERFLNITSKEQKIDSLLKTVQFTDAIQNV